MPKICWIAVAVLLATPAGVRADWAKWRPDGNHVLVIYAADDADSRAAAEYYSARRNVPPANLLGLKLDTKQEDRPDYAEFFQHILTPVAKRLSAAEAKDICYLVTCPGIPLTVDTGHRRPPNEGKNRNWFARTSRRGVDQFLISSAANIKAGLGRNINTDRKTGQKTEIPAAGAAGMLGSQMHELALRPFFSIYSSEPKAKHFRRLRSEDPERFDFHLVGRLGLSLDSARDMVDRALYAERHLRLPGPNEKTPLRPEIWLDMKYGFAADHVASMAMAVTIARGEAGSPLGLNEGLRRPWPVVIDNQPAEIGSGNPAHKPTVTVKIRAVDRRRVTLAGPGRAGRGKDAPPAYYFPVGWTVTKVIAPSGPTDPDPTTTTSASTAPSAKIVRVDLENNSLLLDSTEGFAAGDEIRAVWGSKFPADNCMIFYGFYGLGKFEDVRRFPPGAVGVHVDSGCMRWARGAIDRGITATYGVTTEPLSVGIPYGHLLLLALARGYDWAEAVYAATPLAQRWAGVCLGDPLYAPFRSAQLPDTTPPVIGEVHVAGGAGGITISAALAGKTPDELADVALFKLEYGPTAAYGQTIDFSDWPQPANGDKVDGRRFGYSRHFRWTLTGLEKGQTYHYRLTARDPAGLQTATPDATFTP